MKFGSLNSFDNDKQELSGFTLFDGLLKTVATATIFVLTMIGVKKILGYKEEVIVKTQEPEKTNKT